MRQSIRRVQGRRLLQRVLGYGGGALAHGLLVGGDGGLYGWELVIGQSVTYFEGILHGHVHAFAGVGRHEVGGVAEEGDGGLGGPDLGWGKAVLRAGGEMGLAGGK